MEIERQDFNVKNRFLIVIFCILIGLSAALVLIVPADVESVRAENREITKMPALNSNMVFSGKFAQTFEAFVNDHVGFRSELTKMSEAVEQAYGFTSELGKVVSIDKDVGTGTTSKTKLLIRDNKIMEVFRQNNDGEAAYIRTVNHYAKKLPDDINLYCMILPTQLEFQEPMYANIQNSQKDTIDTIYQNLNKRVKTVDAYSVLKEHKNEYVYFRTDHHWTALGAYYGYEAFSKASGAVYADKNKFSSHIIRNFTGSLSKQVPGDAPQEPDYIEWYDTNPDKKIKLEMQGLDSENKWTYYDGTMFDEGIKAPGYDFFMGGDHAMGEIKNPNQTNGKTLLILKDSYANAFIPWVTQNYETTIIIDPRSYWANIDDILKRYDVDDCLIMNYIFATTFTDLCDLLVDIY